MNVLAFDTHAFVKRLTGAGMPEAQAEVLADEQRRLIDHRLATKDDVDAGARATQLEIEKVRAEFRADIAETRAELTRSIAETKAELTRSIAETKAELTRSIAETRAELIRSIAETKADILKWMFGTIGFQTLVMLGAVFALSRFGR